MNQYFATFPAGTYDIIARHLKSFDMQELRLIEHDDSSVLFEAFFRPERLIELRYFTNIYRVIDDSGVPRDLLRNGYYRLMLLNQGAPEALPATERARLEARIQHDFGLKAHTHRALNEFFVIGQASGRKLFTLRLARAKFKRDKLAPGELRPELAHVLCLAAGLKAKYAVVAICSAVPVWPMVRL